MNFALTSAFSSRRTFNSHTASFNGLAANPESLGNCDRSSGCLVPVQRPVVGLYLIAALLMKPAPVVPLSTADEQEFYDSYANSRHLAVVRLKRRYRNLERRLQRMEHTVTSREFDWNEKLDS